MNTLEIKGEWAVAMAKLKQKYAILTDNDLMLIEGKKDEVLGKIQAKLGKTKEEFAKIISEL
jgi:uncharacterized protein YjbJ (UPF0337 family)